MCKSTHEVGFTKIHPSFHFEVLFKTLHYAGVAVSVQDHYSRYQMRSILLKLVLRLLQSEHIHIHWCTQHCHS